LQRSKAMLNSTLGSMDNLLFLFLGVQVDTTLNRST